MQDNNQQKGINPSFDGQKTSFHTHNGVDSPVLPIKGIKNIYWGFVNTTPGTYTASPVTTLPVGWSVSIGATTCTITHNLGTINLSILLTGVTQQPGGTRVNEVIGIENQTTTTFRVGFIGVGGSGNTVIPFSFLVIVL